MGNPLFNMMNGGKGLPFNPQMMQLLQTIRSGGNPQQLLAQINPQFANLSPADAKTMCERICREKGLDLNTVVQQIQNLIRK